MKRLWLIDAWMVLFTGIVFTLFAATDGFSGEAEPPLIGHVHFGKMVIQNDDPTVDGGDYEINTIGLDVQKTLHPGALIYGYETGAMVSLDSTVRRFRASSGSEGGRVAVAVDIDSILVDYYFGGYLGIEPVRWFRLYAGAGPLIIWGSRETKTEATATEPANSDSESGLGVGLYGRAGVDILFTETFGINAGVRVTETTLSFEDAVGDVDLEGWQYYAGFAFRF